MKKLLFLVLLFSQSICSAAPTKIACKKDQSVTRLKLELETAGLVVVSIKPISGVQLGREKMRVQESTIVFDRELSAGELTTAQSVIDAHEGDLARKIRLKIVIKNLTKKLRDDTITNLQLKTLLLAIIERWRFEE